MGKVESRKWKVKSTRHVNEEQLALYFGIGKYISENTREGNWEKVQLKVLVVS